MRDRYSFKAQEYLGKRSVAKGGIILTAEPFAYAISSHLRGQYCDYCLGTDSLRPLTRCKDCTITWYCDEMCMFNGREVHKHECKHLKKMLPDIPSNLVRLIARIMMRLKNGGENYVDYYTDSKGRKFKDLMNHYRDVKSSDDRMIDVRKVMKDLGGYLGEDILPNESDFIGIYGRVLVNRFCLMDELNSPIGSAVYLSGSIFDHSCKPNAYPSFIGKKLVIRSLVDIGELDYNKIFISYIDIAMTRKQRREELRNNWFFICECTHCQANPLADFENCIECENPLCDQLISVPEKPDSQFAHTPSKPIECPSCRCLVDEDTIADYQSAVAFTRQRLKSLKEESPALETCLAILEKQGNLLPPLNVWRVRALDFAFNSVSHLGIWNKVLEYGKSNMAGMKLHYGDEHPSLGLFYMKMSRASMYLKMYREGLKYGQLSESILKVAFGPNHLLITEVIHRLMTIANEDLEILLERRIEKQKQNEHEKVCKHCGKRKGIKPKINEDEKEKNKLIVVPKPTTNGIVKDIEPVEKPKENLIVTFKPNGTTKELLSDRVLEYLNSLEIY